VPKAPLEATFSDRAEALPAISRYLDRVGTQLSVPPGALTDLRIAIDEVVTNILNYAWGDEGAHGITIRCRLLESRLETTIEDDGVAFDPLQAATPDVQAPLAERQVGGLGVHFVRNLMSGVAYERVAGRNRLILTQDLEPVK